MAEVCKRVGLRGNLMHVLVRADSQGWTLGRPEELSESGALDDQLTVREAYCGRCMHPGLAYHSLRRKNRRPGYRALMSCVACGFTEEW